MSATFAEIVNWLAVLNIFVDFVVNFVIFVLFSISVLNVERWPLNVDRWLLTVERWTLLEASWVSKRLREEKTQKEKLLAVTGIEPATFQLWGHHSDH